jgi:hypothetical protein
MLKKVIFVACVLSASLYSQDRAAINGVVKDPSGAVVPDAHVELKSAATGFHRAVQTNSGSFRDCSFGVGTYHRCRKTGFKSVSFGDRLQYAETRTIDTRLEVGAPADRSSRATAERSTAPREAGASSAGRSRNSGERP